VLHVQRALADLGYAEAASSPGGQYDALTRNAVVKYQISRGEAQTGILTRDQFTALFEGDPNVTVEVDTHEDHSV
jgi:peptidoglycan hydrolase-like protein with peptidoglycan-binding domain